MVNHSLTVEASSSLAAGVEQLYWGQARGWFGNCLLFWTEAGLCGLDLAPASGSKSDYQQYWQAQHLRRYDTEAGRISARLFVEHPFDLQLHLRGTEFQLKVWQSLLKIPAGETVSYGKLSELLGLGRQGARAVGGAVVANRIAIVIPCHRVLPASGGIGGFRWGADIKRALLDREKLSAVASVRAAA
jgi:AraC family transcriptional regulator of adaptative response/methylated-DNA-[protein]-cysteine methyltransferase